MKLLVVDDDAFFRRLLQQTLAPSYEVLTATDGVNAWRLLHRPSPPPLAILDWVMPGMSGPQLCREIRQSSDLSSMYLILLTAKNSPAEVIAGFRAGADDYVTKPFDVAELRARVRVGARLVEMQAALLAQETTLNETRLRERSLRALLPVCPVCRQLRIGVRYWPRLKKYLDSRAATLRNGHCPECTEQVVNSEFQLADHSSGEIL